MNAPDIGHVRDVRLSAAQHRRSFGVACAALVALLAGCGAQEQPRTSAPPQPAVSSLELERIRAGRDGPVYYLGDSFERLPLTHAEGSARGVFFVYGKCHGEGEGDSYRCAGPQVQLQQTPIASPARYGMPYRGCVRTTVKGVPAGQFDGFEVYTGEALVKIYARDFREAKHAAEELRPLGADEPAGSLPIPAIDVDEPLRRCALESLPAKLADLTATAEIALFWLGRAFEAQPLARAEGHGRWARFSYGACLDAVSREGECWPPLTVEVQPTESFRPAGWAPGIECTALRVGTAWAALVPDAHELVLYGGDVAIRLQGEDIELLRRAAHALRGLNRGATLASAARTSGGVVQELGRRCEA
jgi:hypothetical protein